MPKNYYLTPKLIKEAKDYFLQKWRSDFLQKRDDSLCWRYLVSREMERLWYVDFIPEDWVFQCWKYYFSSSHSDDLILIIIDTKKCAIDCEKIQSKPIEFYQTRVSKECLIKFLDLKLDRHEKMTVSLGEDMANVSYKWLNYKVKIWEKDGFVLGII